MTARVLGKAGVDFLEGRGISTETAVRFGIATGRHQDGKVIPDPQGNILVFPFQENEQVVAVKFRGPDKRFWQKEGGKRTFWNSDVLDDPGLAAGHYPLIITEGELDALTAIQCGFPVTVSVPDGAPGVPDGQEPEDLPPLDPQSEKDGKFSFCYRNKEKLARVKRFILAVDNDLPGKRLAAELVRRFTPARCSFVEYPAGCKDLNDVLRFQGPEAVVSVLNSAKPYPVRGLYRLSDYPELPAIPAYSTGWWTMDPHLKLFAGEFMVVTGIPGHGKSTWVLNLLTNMAEQHGWRSVVFSPEMPAVPHLRDKLRRIKSGRDSKFRPEIDAWIEDNFVFIDADPASMSDTDFDLDWIIDKAIQAVQRDGIRILVIDPWNEVEHAKRKDETVTDYIGRSIRELKKFAKLYQVAVIVVAHPTKEVGRDGKGRSPTLYDIEGSAHWFNKCDHGVVIDRPDPHLDESIVRIAKCRFEETGDKGDVRMAFNRFNARFDTLEPLAEAAE